MEPPLISAIVVAYASREKKPFLEECLMSLRGALHEVSGATELIVVVNQNSETDLGVELRELAPDAVVLVPGGNLGFAGGVALGLRRARGQWVALINDDATVDRRALVEMISLGRSAADVGSVAAQMRFADRPDVINSAGIEVDRIGVAYDRLLGLSPSLGGDRPVDVFGASGGAALYRDSMLDEIGGFDESFFAYLEDVDVAWRARMMGWRCVYAPRAVVYHHHSATLGHRSARKYFLVGRNRVRLLAKNASTRQLVRYGAGMLAYDVAYVAYAAVKHRTFAPLRGRLQGLREWRTYRRRGKPFRQDLALSRIGGFRRAIARERAWAGDRSPHAHQATRSR